MRILFVSDSPTVPGAYGIQSRMLVKWMQEAGHDVLYFGTTYYGPPLTIDGIRLVGGAARGDLFGDSLINYYADRHQADIIMTLKDPYVFNPNALRRFNRPWVPIVPIDTEPLNVATMNQLSYAFRPVAVTRIGQEMMREQGIAAYYAPHVIDTDFWTPGSQQRARERLGLPLDAFVVSFVGANNSREDRKNIAQLVLAWKAFVSHPDNANSVLYLHTSMSQRYGGINLEALLTISELSPVNYRVTEQEDYDTASVPQEFLRTVYRASDAFAMVSGGEGFCVPVVEAQACGIPVIASDFTALRETAGVGWKLKTGANTGEALWCPLAGFRFMPMRIGIMTAFKMARDNEDKEAMASAAVLFARQYSSKTALDTYWTPILNDLQSVLKEGDLLNGQPKLEDEARLERAS